MQIHFHPYNKSEKRSVSNTVDTIIYQINLMRQNSKKSSCKSKTCYYGDDVLLANRKKRVFVHLQLTFIHMVANKTTLVETGHDWIAMYSVVQLKQMQLPTPPRQSLNVWKNKQFLQRLKPCCGRKNLQRSHIKTWFPPVNFLSHPICWKLLSLFI